MKHINLSKAAKGISINHITKLPELVQISKKWEQLWRTFVLIINHFRDDRYKVRTDNLKSVYGVIDFINRSSSSLITESYSICIKIDKLKYSYEELKYIFDRNPLPNGIPKRNMMYVKSIYNYLNQMYELINEIEKWRTGIIY